MNDNDLKVSFGNLIKYLEEYSTAEVIKKPKLIEGLRSLHKRLFSLLCWRIELFSKRKDSPDYLWLDESLSDMMQLISIITQGYYKVANTIQRGAIENFIRYYITANGLDPSQYTTVYSLFDSAREITKGKNDLFVKARLDSMYQIYGELCNYVHTSGIEYGTFNQALKEYPSFNATKFNETLTNISKSMQLMNAILASHENEAFKKMYHKNKDAVLENLQKEEKRYLN